MAFEKGNKAAVGHRTPHAAFQKTCRAVVDAEVIRRWTDEVRNGGEHWVKCSELLAAYGYGKPQQQVEVSGTIEHEHSGLSPDERRAAIRQLREELASQVAH